MRFSLEAAAAALAAIEGLARGRKLSEADRELGLVLERTAVTASWSRSWRATCTTSSAALQKRVRRW